MTGLYEVEIEPEVRSPPPAGNLIRPAILVFSLSFRMTGGPYEMSVTL
jgi:hypothetical protein